MAGAKPHRRRRPGGRRLGLPAPRRRRLDIEGSLVAENDPLVTQQDIVGDVAGELVAVGFADPQEIGRGAFGVVYRCLQPDLDRTVAVKVLTADLDQVNLERFMREQRAMGRLSGHPNIVNILQVGTLSCGRPFIVMQYHPHGSLGDWIRNRGALDWREVLRQGIKLAGALAEAHRAGILHRDVKPGNILLTEYGEAQLTDFGIARIVGGFETGTGLITGTPAFTAPEVLGGATPTVASDVYSLGATLFCALTGHAAFERRSGESVVAQFLRISRQPIPDLGRVDAPEPLIRAIERGMARDPVDRPASAAEFGAQLCEIGRRLGIETDVVVRLDPDQAPVPATPNGGRTHLRSADRPASTTAPPTPATRHHPPRLPRAQVTRRRLIETLRAGEWRRLTVIRAPSGYGKSTLVAQWAEELNRDGIAVAWLTVDEDDNNTVWFLAHLLTSIHRVRPNLAASLGQLLETHADDPERYVLTALIEEIHAGGEKIALVIDDWQRVSDPQTIAALGFLIEHGCHHMHIIVTSWSLDGLPVSRLRILDEVNQIDADTLRFDATEAEILLDEVGGLRLSPEEVAELTASTDGWAVALQLAALSLAANGDTQGLLKQLSAAGDVIGISAFLGENVLDSLEPDMVDFVVASSITERTCGDLATTLSGNPRGQALLEEVESRGLLLKRIPEEPGWFRYHHLARQFLRRRLERDHPERIESLHRAAALWLADHDYLSEAVDHALAAGDSGLAIELVERDRTNLIEQARMATFLGIAAKLPARLMVRRPRLQLTIAWANLLLPRPVQLAAALHRFETALDGATLPEHDRAELRAEADAIRAAAQVFSDRTEGVEALIAGPMSEPDALYPLLALNSGNLSAFTAIYRFDFEAAYRFLEWAEPYHQMLQGQFGAVFARCFAGIAARYQLDIPRALDYFRDARELGMRAGPRSHAALLAAAMLGELLYETGELAEAAPLLEESYQFGFDGGGVDYLTARFVATAKSKAANGDQDGAADRLDAGMRAAEQYRLPRLAAAVNNARVRLGITLAPQVAAQLRAPRTTAHDDGIATMTAELDEDSGIRLLGAGGSAAEHDEACRRAADLFAGIDGARRPLAALQAELLLVQTLIAAGRHDAADARAPALTARCRDAGLLQLLADAGLG
ncbi:protein kinase domain-containing protein [Mycolicibacterium thermoresistibile]